MNIKNRKLSTSVIASAAIVFGLGMSMASTASAHSKGGYASGGNGKVLRDGSGRCVTAAWGNSYAECEPKLVEAQPVSKPAPAYVPPVKVAVVKPAPKPVYRPAPKPQYITKTLSLNESAGANFGFDNDSLSSGAQQQLASFANSVRSSNINPSSVSVVGHTDSIGAKKYNQKLSERRANSVAGYLSGQGINRAIMKVSGRGELQPVASNKTKAGRAQNRRVDIRVTGQRKVTVRK